MGFGDGCDALEGNNTAYSNGDVYIGGPSVKPTTGLPLSTLHVFSNILERILGSIKCIGL